MPDKPSERDPCKPKECANAPTEIRIVCICQCCGEVFPDLAAAYEHGRKRAE